MKNKTSKEIRILKHKWVSAIPIICVIVYFILAWVLDKYTDTNHPYLLSLLVFLIIPFDYAIVGLEKLKMEYPLIITLIYVIGCIIADAAFDLSLWHPFWVIFLTIPIFYIFNPDIKEEKEKEIHIDFDADEDDD